MATYLSYNFASGWDALSVEGAQLVLEHASTGRVVCSLTASPLLLNRNATMHGGALATLVDNIGSAPLVIVGDGRDPRLGTSMALQVCVWPAC